MRWKTALLAGGLLVAPAAALAQSTPDPQAATPPPSDAIGPRELQNFSLPGNATKSGDQPVAAPAATSTAPPATTTPQPQAARTTVPPVRRTADARQPARAVAAPAAPPPSTVDALSKAPPATPPLPPPSQSAALQSPPAASAPSFATVSVPETAAPGITPDHKFPLLPWLLAALALAAGTAFLLWRRREAFAGVPRFDQFVMPEPAPPLPQPAPQPRPAAPRNIVDPPKPAASSGIVASRLRPAIEISVQPLRCLVEDDRLLIEFELELFNAGTAPARGVIAEASLFNAGAAHDQELAAFFSRPPATGEPLEAIPPMRRMNFTSQVVAPRAALQEYELGGRKAVVPVLAFNAIYQWSGGDGQTSAAYLVGRDTNGDKLGPFALDRTPREFRKLAAHALPAAVRT